MWLRREFHGIIKAMPQKDSEPRNILGTLAGIIAGAGMLALAARETLLSRRESLRADDRPGARSLGVIMRSQPRPRRKPPEAGLPMPAVPPRGPVPLRDGAVAALDPESE